MSDFREFYPIIKDELFKKHNNRIIGSPVRALGIMLHDNQQLIQTKNLRYFNKPTSQSYPLNLNLGYDEYKFRSAEYFSFNLKQLEKYLMENDGKLLQNITNKQQICASRHVLRLLLMTPYRLNNLEMNNWTIKAIKFGNVIYLTKDREIERQKNRHQTYHFKFQQYCFADSPYKTPNTDEPIDEDYQLTCIFKTTLDEFEIFYSAEIAGVESKHEIKNFTTPGDLKKCHFVLTKLLKDDSRDSNWRNHPKLLQWWIQAYLGCVDKIYVGLKTQNGFINKQIECIESRDLPKFKKWKPQICKRFLVDFLKNVKSVMSAVDCPYITYEFHFDALLQMIKYRIFEGKNEETFLTEHFIQYMQMK